MKLSMCHLLCAVCLAVPSAGLGAVLEGPVTVYTHADARPEWSLPSNLIYGHEDEAILLRSAQYPVSVNRLVGLPSDLCSVTSAALEPVTAFGSDTDVTTHGLMAIAESPNTIYCLYRTPASDTILAGFAKSDYTRTFETTVTPPFGLGAVIMVTEDAVFISGPVADMGIWLEQRTLAGDHVWSYSLALQEGVGEVTDVVKRGQGLYIAVGGIDELSTASATGAASKVFVCTLNPDYGTMTMLTDWAGEYVPWFPPAILKDASSSEFAVVYDANSDRSAVDVRMACFDNEFQSIGENQLTTGALEASSPVMAARRWVPMGGGRYALVVGVDNEAAFLVSGRFEEWSDFTVHPIPLSGALVTWSNLNLNRLPGGAVLSVEVADETEIRGEFFFVCDP